MVRRFLANCLALMLLSAFFFAAQAVAVKFISPSIGVMEIAAFRFAIGLVILLTLMVPRRISLRGQRNWLLLLRGFAGFLGFVCLLKSIAKIPLANAMVLYYTFPVFTTFFSFLVLHERVGKWEMFLIAAGLIGVYVLLESGSNLYERGDFFALLGASFHGLSTVLIRKLRQTEGNLIIYFYTCLVGGVVSFPLMLKLFRMPDLGQFLFLVFIGLMCFMAQILMNQGFKVCKASEGAVILMSELVFAGVAGVVIFGDLISARLLVGALLILGSGVGLNLINRLSRYEVLEKGRV